jgi:hypothetical protein
MLLLGWRAIDRMLRMDMHCRLFIGSKFDCSMGLGMNELRSIQAAWQLCRV